MVTAALAILFHPLAGLVTGLILSLAIGVIGLDNPYRIPLKVIARRAPSPSLALLVVGWYIVSAGLMYGLSSLVASVTTHAALLWALALAIGLIVPLGRWSDAVPMSVGGPARAKLPMGALRRLDATTTRYFNRVIRAEERLLIADSVEGHLIAIDRLYEYHVDQISNDPEVLEYSDASTTPLRLCLARDRPLKARHLFVYLGYSRCRQRLMELADNPEAIMPTWAADKGDRRHKSDRRESPVTVCPVNLRGCPYGRRKMDKPRARAAVVFAR